MVIFKFGKQTAILVILPAWALFFPILVMTVLENLAIVIIPDKGTLLYAVVQDGV